MARSKRITRRRPQNAGPVDPADVSMFRDAMKQLEVIPDRDQRRYDRVLPGDFDPSPDELPDDPSRHAERGTPPAVDPAEASLFEDAMKQLDVTPVGTAPATSPPPARTPEARSRQPEPAAPRPDAERRTRAQPHQQAVEPADVSLFMRAMQQLDVVPDKEPPKHRRTTRAVRRRRPPKTSAGLIDDRLDLHHNRVEDALTQLDHFVQRARHRGHRRVIVITGKGHHSPGGIAVIRRAVEDWVVRHGRRHLEAYSDAPRDEGGRGAFLLYLRRSETS